MGKYWTTEAILSLAWSDKPYNIKGEFKFKDKHFLPSFINKNGEVIGHPKSFDYISHDILVESMLGEINGPLNGEIVNLGCEPIINKKGKIKYFVIIGDKDYNKSYSFLMFQNKPNLINL